jgi:hypothetical protein
MCPAMKSDRQHFWKGYKNGIDTLALDATRAYFHQFSNSTRWTKVTVQVMDFDSLSTDDFCGSVDIALPDPSCDSLALASLREIQAYALAGPKSENSGTTLYCSISWFEFPPESRLLGCWNVTIDRATDIPPMDVATKSSDPYCLVIASDDGLFEDGYGYGGRELRAMTCVKARCLNPVWNETICLPIIKPAYSSSIMSNLEAEGVSLVPSVNLHQLFQWDEVSRKRNLEDWSHMLLNASHCREQKSRTF